MIPGATLEAAESGVLASVPMEFKKRGGRKEIIIPVEAKADEPSRPAHQEVLVPALARAYQWQEALDAGRFQSISDLAREADLDPSFDARLLRLTLLAPDIVEAILLGDEPSDLSLTILTKQLPSDWQLQREVLGFNAGDGPSMDRSARLPGSFA